MGYRRKFYEDRHQRTVHAAEAVLSLLFERLPPVTSAIDLGCGVGTWLAILKARGVSVVQGVDGDWVDPALLEIPRDCFLRADLAQPLALGRRFDLALSLEVAEHLPAASAAPFVATLTGLADFVLFSAAVPGQGGRHHVNEQWQSYWGELFAARGYIPFDLIRRGIWSDAAIPYWYKQNTVLFAARERQDELRGDAASHAVAPLGLSLVHPDFFRAKLFEPSLRDAMRVLRRALRRPAPRAER